MRCSALPALADDALVGDVVRERVLEHVRQLGMERLLVDQLEAAQLLDLGADAVARPRVMRSSRRSANSRPITDATWMARRESLGEPVDARDQHVLDRVGHGDGRRARAPGRSGRPRGAARRPRAASGSAPRRRTGCPRPCARSATQTSAGRSPRAEDRAGHGRHLVVRRAAGSDTRRW